MSWYVNPTDVPPGHDAIIRGFRSLDVDRSSAPPIDLADLEREYCKLVGQLYPIKEMVFVRSWMLFRVRFWSQYSIFILF